MSIFFLRVSENHLLPAAAMVQDFRPKKKKRILNRPYSSVSFSKTLKLKTLRTFGIKFYTEGTLRFKMSFLIFLGLNTRRSVQGGWGGHRLCKAYTTAARTDLQINRKTGFTQIQFYNLKMQKKYLKSKISNLKIQILRVITDFLTYHLAPVHRCRSCSPACRSPCWPGSSGSPQAFRNGNPG